MRLEKIKLSGFKSFVDPTVVTFPSELSGIVGPNGCGKSNIIDAVRWVMGESSAKQLRGNLITDIIFNGSVDRKPVGQASIELILDNSDGVLVGEYAKYNQISVRREVDRDGQSSYFLNNHRCRRRDITGVFLGTGLGPRSYAIIEQGMISRIIEAKPEELRIHLEEVAGISKYKERRRETENRIKHTRDNLNRIADLREELGKQLRHIKRQANAAERYKLLKQEERLLKAQLIVLRWQGLEEERKIYDKKTQHGETKLEACRAALQSLDTEIEKKRIKQIDCNDIYNSAQKHYYEIGSEITNTEQIIAHKRERSKQLADELNVIEKSLVEAQNSLKSDNDQTQDIKQSIHILEPQIQNAQHNIELSHKKLLSSEQDTQSWQIEWESFNNEAATVIQHIEVQQTRKNHIDEQQLQIMQRLGKLDQEYKQLDSNRIMKEILQEFTQSAKSVKSDVEKQQQLLTDISHEIQQQREKSQSLDEQLQIRRQQVQELNACRVSLETLQQADLDKNDKHINSWLEKNNLQKSLRLAQLLQVESGWEQAIETVLSSYLDAICVTQLDSILPQLEQLSKSQITLLETNRDANRTSRLKYERLIDKVETKSPASSLLSSVYIAKNFSDALKIRSSLMEHESIVTKEGDWIGKNWIRVVRGDNTEDGVLKRELKLRKIKEELPIKQNELEKTANALKSIKDHLSILEQQREEIQQNLALYQHDYSQLQAKQKVKQSQFEQTNKRCYQLINEKSELKQQIAQAKNDLTEAKKLLQEYKLKMEHNNEIRNDLLNKRNECNKILQQAREQERIDKDANHSLLMESNSFQNRMQALQQTAKRAEQQIKQLLEQRIRIEENLHKHDEPGDELQKKLELNLSKRLDAEKELTISKQKLDQLEHETQTLLNSRHKAENSLEEARRELENKRLHGQELQIRQSTLQEQLKENNYELDKLLLEISTEATEQQWQEALEKIVIRIGRLGPINLAAIGEHKELQERKDYLDMQYSDLETALDTLETAMRKIDKETRERFRETFDITNRYFKELFPKVFNGGKGYLELTGEDLLTTGVTLMVRPPGKHISNIHLLSGGEKALTALALVFSLFQLTPAPFCMLDEVDAALDDRNISRFCELVKEMSEKVQFIFVSHNKNAILMANHLIGVTMNEPGVSRIVAVNIDEAMAMAQE